MNNPIINLVHCWGPLPNILCQLSSTIFFKIRVGHFVPWDLLSLETFCPLGRFVPGTFCPLGPFVPGDILSFGHFVPGTFCPLGRLGPYVLGRFIPGDVLSWDVLSVHRIWTTYFNDSHTKHPITKHPHSRNTPIVNLVHCWGPLPNIRCQLSSTIVFLH